MRELLWLREAWGLGLLDGRAGLEVSGERGGVLGLEQEGGGAPVWSAWPGSVKGPGGDDGFHSGGTWGHQFQDTDHLKSHKQNTLQSWRNV